MVVATRRTKGATYYRFCLFCCLAQKKIENAAGCRLLPLFVAILPSCCCALFLSSCGRFSCCPQNGTFIVSEQIPGYVINNDVSSLVQKNGYFGSYNTAFDPYLRQISGADAAEAKAGPWLGYWTTARAQIFRRDQVM